MHHPFSASNQLALDNYLALLHNLGADESNLLRRKTFLTTLLRDLEKIPHDSRVYGILVDEKLAMFTQPELKHFYQSTAREFYWFWSNDDEKVDAMYRGEYITVNPFTITLTESLEDLHRIAQEYYAAHPHPALDAYRRTMTEPSNIRLQWAMSILYAFKDFEQEDYAYRASVDALLNLINNRTMKQSLLVVVRELHKVWKSHKKHAH